MTKQYWIGEVPTHCELSGRPIEGRFVDGVVPGVGSWAFAHPDHFRDVGGTLGLGCGQLYERQEDGRWLKTEG